MKPYPLLVIVTLIISCGTPKTNQSESIDFMDIQEGTIVNLYDAFGESNLDLTMDFGFSCVMKYKGKTILFDAGSNADVFKSNVERLKIDLRKIDLVIASHSHFDHINGLDHLLDINPEVKIYFPFDPFWGANFSFNLTGKDSLVADSLEAKMKYFNGHFENYSFDQSGRFWKANVEFVKESTEIFPGIKLIATTSPNMGYFTKYPRLSGDEELIGDDKPTTDQANLTGLKELSLSLDSDDGEILVVGCSHSTVEQIVTDAKTFTDSPISLVYGGYHLLPYDRSQLNSLANRLKDELDVARVAPAHCTGHLAFKILQDKYQADYLYAGLGSTLKW